MKAAGRVIFSMKVRCLNRNDPAEWDAFKTEAFDVAGSLGACVRHMLVNALKCSLINVHTSTL